LIIALRGKVFKKNVSSIYLDVNGVIYDVNVSLNSYSEINLNDDILIYITENIREDSYTLYGFLSESEKEMFDTVIKLNGIGPKVAMAICSTYKVETFAQIIESKNVTALTKVPGIGPKGAKRILVELSEFVVSSIESKPSPKLDAQKALETLGFKSDIIINVLKKVSSTSTEDIIKDALKLLS
jgi:Holliday junction DNA helicase RuvA